MGSAPILPVFATFFNPNVNQIHVRGPMGLMALWWWIDRWRKSTAYTDMTLEEQGAYRNLLDEAHLRGGAIPNDERILGKACGDALAWGRVRPAVLAKFELQADGWHNATLEAVLRESSRRADKQARYRARKSGTALGTETEIRDGDGDGDGDPPRLPHLLPAPLPVPLRTHPKKPVDTGPDARSKWPIFKGIQLVVFDWMLEDLRRMLGTHVDAFGLDEWFVELDQRIRRDGLVVPPRDGGAWLLAQTLAEAERRGLPIAKPAPKPNPMDQSQFAPGTSTEDLAAGLRQRLAEERRTKGSR